MKILMPILMSFALVSCNKVEDKQSYSDDVQTVEQVNTNTNDNSSDSPNLKWVDEDAKIAVFIDPDTGCEYLYDVDNFQGYTQRMLSSNIQKGCRM